MIYFTFGTKDILEHECKDLDQRLEVFMDGQRVPLPSLESLVVLNIACWGAGVKAWTLGAGECGAEARELLAVSPVVNHFIAVVFMSSVC